MGTIDEEHRDAQAVLLLKEIYQNDLIMKNILRHVELKDRIKVELASRRFYQLSNRTPCLTGKDLILDVSYRIVTAQVCLLTKNVLLDDLDELPCSLSLCNPDELYDLLKKYSKKFKGEIRKIYFLECLDSQFLKIINDGFPLVTELHCESFSDDAVEYLKSNEQSLTDRITDFEIEVSKIPKECNIFVLFKNLKKFYTSGLLSNRTISELDDRSTVIDTISMDLMSQPDCLIKISKKCKNFELCPTTTLQERMMETLFRVQNLTVLTVKLGSLCINELFIFFRRINIHNLTVAKLTTVEFNENLLTLLTPNENSKLLELELEDWSRIDDSTVPLATIFPKSLETIRLMWYNLQSTDLQIIPDKCPNLKYLYLEEYGNEINKVCLEKAINKLKKLEGFGSNRDLKYFI